MKGFIRSWARAFSMLLIMVIGNVFISVAYAAVSPVIIDNALFRNTSLVPYIEQYTGKTNPQNIQQAARLPDSEYTQIKSAFMLLPSSQWWFRFFVHNKTNATSELIFNLDQSLVSEINLLASVDGVVLKNVQTGQRYPYVSRDTSYNTYAFRLSVPAGKTLAVNFSLNPEFSMLLAPVLVKDEVFPEQLTTTNYFSGSIMGMLYAVCLFMTIYVLYTRALGVGFWMWAFSVASFLSVLYMAGIIQRVFPETLITWRSAAYLWIHGVQVFAFVMVVRSYYRVASRFPLFDKVLLLSGIGCLLCIPMVSLVPFFVLTMTVMGLSTVILLMGFALAVWMLIFYRKDTWLFSIGLLLFAFFTLFSTLPAYGIQPVPLLSRYGYEIGLTMQVDFLFLAIVFRIFSAEREKLEAESHALILDAEMQARSEFVDRVTHDVKSPLSAVIGAVHLLREPVSPEQRTKYLDVIQQSCNTVITIVDGILSYSRFKSGSIALHKQSFSAAALLTEIENAINVTYSKKNVTFSVSGSDTLPPLVVGDRNRLQQLLNNLLTNAFKFTDEGSVNLVVSVIARTVDTVSLRFEVRDTGIGMSPEFVLRAFEPYAREESHSGYRQGFGLGLPICKQLAEMMHGTIQLSSSLGEGSVFTVELPFDLSQ